MDYKKFLTAVILSGLIYLVVSNILGLITQSVLPYDWASVPGMRAMSDPLVMGMFLYGFVASIAAVIIYPEINFKGTMLQKGAKLGLLMWLATSIPSAWIIYTTMLYPTGFYLDTIVFGLATWACMGAGIAWVYKQEKKKK
jgi:hypothetical protein